MFVFVLVCITLCPLVLQPSGRGRESWLLCFGIEITRTSHTLMHDDYNYKIQWLPGVKVI